MSDQYFYHMYFWINIDNLRLDSYFIVVIPLSHFIPHQLPVLLRGLFIVIQFCKKVVEESNIVMVLQ